MGLQEKLLSSQMDLQDTPELASATLADVWEWAAEQTTLRVLLGDWLGNAPAPRQRYRLSE